MFTNKEAKYYGDNKVLLDSACLSTDTKPTTGVANGSKCIEMDTGKTYMFNEEDSEWEELPSSGGGGGGGGDGYLGIHTATVNVTFDTSSISGDVEAIEYAYLYLGYDENSSTYAINFSYDSNEGTLPITELGTPTQMQIPTSDDYPAYINDATFSWFNTSSSSLMATEITAVSGSVTQTEYGVVVTGDCSLNIKVGYQG